MNKLFILAGTFLVAAGVPSAASATAVLDGGFEAQGAAEIGANPGYCYDNNGLAGPQCTGIGAPWIVQGGGGFQNEGNTAWPGTLTPDGSFYAFIQNTGSLSQTFVSNASGLFTLNFLAAGRNNPLPNAGNALYQVLINNVVIFGDSTVSGQPFTARTTGSFQLVSGQSYTLTFQGLSNGYDNTAFIDAISFAAVVPEPSTWAMMLLGFGVVGAAMRRRRRNQTSDVISFA